MGARIAYGAAWGALPTAGAVAAGADGNVGLTVCFGLIAVIASLVIPLAPFLPFLNQLPLVGSPRLEVVFRLNGRRDLQLTVRPGEEHTCILEIEVLNPSRWFSVKEAWVNLVIPSGIKIRRCNQIGQHKEGGGWEHFYPHQLGSHSRVDYWNDANWNFPPNLMRGIRIKLRLGLYDEDIDYPILFVLGAPSLYEDIEAAGTVKVRLGEPSRADEMGKLITDGERMLGQVQEPAILPQQEKEHRIAAMAFAAAATGVLNAAISDDPLPETPDDADASTHAEKVQMYLTALYVVRNELGQEEDWS